jgi:pSer/pThr/pTyr-binding forkhead associated (FHA) protein
MVSFQYNLIRDLRDQKGFRFEPTRVHSMKRPPVIVVQLIHIFGPLKGEIQEFSDPAISIGRHPSSQVCFPPDLTLVSRNHAEIIREGNQFKLIDHSTNGTLVNGKRVKEIILKNGDVLAFAEGGPKVSFLTQIREDSAEVQAPPPPAPPVRQPLPTRSRMEPPRPSGERPPYAKPPASPPVEEVPDEGSAQMSRVPLSIQYGPTIRSFKRLPVLIGRSPKCDFILDHPAIFDQHAQILFSQNQYWLKDLTGKGSVKVNRYPVSIQTPLKLNDEVALSPQGPVFRFLGEGRFAEIMEPSAEGSPEPPPKKGKGQQTLSKEKETTGFLSKWIKRKGS